MNTVKAAAAHVTGAAHQRMGRNGQDAAVAWARAGQPSDLIAVVVVADGCSSGASSEVGARLGARLFARAIADRLVDGMSPNERQLWEMARQDVRHALADLVERLAPADMHRGDVVEGMAPADMHRGDVVERMAPADMHRGDVVDRMAPADVHRADERVASRDALAIVHDYFLFTLIGAAVTRDAAAIWALGDGVYSLGGETRVLGPFADNQPPYLGYDLLGEPASAHFVTAEPCSLVIATDGASELDLAQFASDRFVDHPDTLRRHLAMLARSTQRIDWAEQRVVQTPAAVQDDIAVGIVRFL